MADGTRHTFVEYVIAAFMLLVLAVCLCGGLLKILGSGPALRGAPVPFKLAKSDWPVGKWKYVDPDNTFYMPYYFDLNSGGTGSVSYYVEDPADPTKGLRKTHAVKWELDVAKDVLYVREKNDDGLWYHWVIHPKRDKIRR